MSEVPTHDSNLRFDEDLPVRELPQERLVLFRLLYVAKEPGRVLCSARCSQTLTKRDLTSSDSRSATKMYV